MVSGRLVAGSDLGFEIFESRHQWASQPAGEQNDDAILPEKLASRATTPSCPRSWRAEQLDDSDETLNETEELMQFALASVGGKHIWEKSRGSDVATVV